MEHEIGTSNYPSLLHTLKIINIDVKIETGLGAL